MTSFVQASLRRYLNLSDLPSVATAKANLSLVKADVGLGSVDNTADTAKPVSTAQAAAIALKMALAGTETVTGQKTFTETLIHNRPSIGQYTIQMKEGGVDCAYWGANTSFSQLIYNAAGNFVALSVTPGGAVTAGASLNVAGDPVMTRGASETKTGNLIMRGQFTSGVGNALAADAYVNISANDNNASYLMIQANGGSRWAFGRPGTVNDCGLYSYGVGGYAMYANYSTGKVDFGYGLTMASKAVISHAGAYTSGLYTASTSAPSGGSDGDTWDVYV